VFQSSVSPGVRIAFITVAATVGALVTFGARHAGAGELFAAGGHLAIQGASVSFAAVAGGVIHVFWISLWSALYAIVARAHRGARTVVDAALVAGAAYVCSMVVPFLAGPLSTLMTSEKVVIHLVLALALAIGMRLARAW
jgi:hypothetical protein